MKNQDIAEININLINNLIVIANYLKKKLEDNAVLKSDLLDAKALLQKCIENLDKATICVTELE